MLSPKQIEKYAKNGYLPGIPILSAQEVKHFNESCHRCCGVEIKDGVRRQASNRVKPFLLYPWASKLIRYKGIFDAVESLI